MSAIGTMDSAVLEARMRALLARGRQAEVDFLLHLMEFDRRRGYEILGYVRLWDYCRKELHFLEGASWRRMRTIGILRRFPVAEEYLRDGRLSMTGLVILEEALTAENFRELFEKAAGRSKKEIDYLAACHRAPVTLGTASIRKASTTRASARDPHADSAAAGSGSSCGTTRTDPAAGADRGSESAVVDDRNEPPAPATPLASTEDGASPTGVTPMAASPTAATPTGLTPMAATPTAATPTGVTPMAAAPTAATPTPIPEPTRLPVPEPRPMRTGSVEALSADCFRVKMTVTKEFVDALEKVQKILGHTVSRTDIAGALKAGLDVILARDAKRKTPKAKQAAAQTAARAGASRARRTRATTKAETTAADSAGANPACADVTCADASGVDAACVSSVDTAGPDVRPRKMSGATEQRAKREHIPIDVARAVWDRDGGCCVWGMASWEKCGSDEDTEIDHIDPVAFGGKPTVSNLRIVCRGHNILHARRCFGDAHMAKFGPAARDASAGESDR